MRSEILILSFFTVVITACGGGSGDSSGPKPTPTVAPTPTVTPTATLEPTSAPSPDYSRTASYTFDDTLADELGIQAAGTATGNRIDNSGGTVSYAVGVHGKALDLNATYGIRLPDNLISSHEYTVSLWLQPRALTQFTTAFFGSATITSWINFAPASWNLNTMLWSGSDVYYDGDANTVIPLDTWTHVAFAIDNGFINLYLDGEVVHSGVGFPDVFSAQTQVFALGVNYWDIPLDGLIDELRIYDTALSVAEVVALDIDNLSDEELPARAAEIIDLGNAAAVTANLPLVAEGPLGSTLSWASSNTAVVAVDGTVTRPALGEDNVEVTLTATLQLNGETIVREIVVTVLAQQPEVSFNPIALDKVRITDGPFKAAQDTNLLYLLSLDPERLLAPYRREAGISTAASNYPSWESQGLDGHIGGHYLSALAMMYAATGDSQILARLNLMIDALQAVQTAQGDGYIGGIPGGKARWASLASGTVNADNFYLNSMWVPWYNLHKLYAGLRDAYVYTGSEKARTMLIALSDWALATTNNLSDEQIQAMLTTEHGGMNEVFADVAALTNEDKYLTAARRFSDQNILTPLLSGLDQLTGKHANTQIPKVIGYARIGKLAHDDAWFEAADYFWNTVVDERSVSIGGNSVREHFHAKDDFSSMINSEQGPETCNTYNMLKLTKSLYQDKGDLKYIDYYERALFNHILSSQHPEHGGLVYFTPMRPNHYRVYSAHDEGMWCCVGSGIENHSKYGEMVYADFEDDFYVNLFVSSTVDWKDGISFTQTTSFPDAENTTLVVQGAGTFALNIRYPGWVAEGQLSLTLNGETQTVSATPGSYIRLDRTWADGDVLSWTMPMQTTLEQMPDGSTYYSILRGPIVLAAEADPFPDETLDFIAGSERMDHIASGQQCPLYIAPVFISNGTEFLANIEPVEGEVMTFTTGSATLNNDGAVTLKPFFRIHDKRYSVYFGQSTEQDWTVLEEELRLQAEAEAALAAITLDEVQPGEQQPEVDHQIESENSATGSHLGRFWRDAGGYFSYVLDPQAETSVILRVTYFGNDGGRNFNILVDDQLLTAVSLTGGQGDIFIDEEYIIPGELIGDGSPIRVKFEAQTGSVAGGVFYVRLIRNES